MTVKNVHHVDLRVPRELWQEIKTCAERENRSINSQIITLLQKAILELSEKDNGLYDEN